MPGELTSVKEFFLWCFKSILCECNLSEMNLKQKIRVNDGVHSNAGKITTPVIQAIIMLDIAYH